MEEVNKNIIDEVLDVFVFLRSQIIPRKSLYLWNDKISMNNTYKNIDNLFKSGQVAKNSANKNVLKYLNKLIKKKSFSRRIYNKFFQSFCFVVSQLGIYVQEKPIVNWGTFSLMEYFPNTVSSVKKFVLQYQPELLKKYDEKRLFDLPVFVRSISVYERQNFYYSTAGYAPQSKRLEIDIGFFNFDKFPANKNEALKAIKSIDNNPDQSYMIAHEIEHWLQRVGRLPGFLRNNLPKGVGARASGSKDLFSSTILNAVKLILPMNFLFKRFIPSYRTLLYKMHVDKYYRSKKEVKARFAQFVYLRLQGKSQEEIVKEANFGVESIPKIFALPEQLRRNEEIWKNEIADLKTKQKNTSGPGKKEIFKKIVEKQKELYYMQTCGRDFTWMLDKAEEIVQKIKEEK